MCRTGAELTLLVFGQLAAVIVDEALRVYEPDPLAGLVLGQTLELEEAHQLHGDTDASGAGTEEENAVVGERATRSGRREFSGVREAREDDGASALDIVVEEGVPIPEGVKEVECLRGLHCERNPRT